MYFVNTPHISYLLYPSLIWKIKEEAKNIFITFDDGPHHTLTPAVLDLLDQYEAKATFFCVGEQVKKNPRVYQSIIEKGHSTGNHTYKHLNGRKVNTSDYLQSIEKASELINTTLFRPPYGKITREQIKMLKSSYKIVMWSVLPGDFDNRISKEMVLKRSIRHTTDGSIVVFHDNAKFEHKMMFALKGFLAHFSKLGYGFKAITPELIVKSKRRITSN